MIGIVYIIKNNSNKKVYVGSTTQKINKRFNEHRSNLRRNTHANSHLQGSWNKYGKGSFSFLIIEEVDFKEIEYLEKVEQFYIDKFDSTNILFGFNKKSAGIKGIPLKESISKAVLNRPNLKGEKSAWFGKKHSEESKNKLSISRLLMYHKNNKYYGVSKNNNSFSVRVKRKYIGTYALEIEAAKMYDSYVIENNLNLPLNFEDI